MFGGCEVVDISDVVVLAIVGDVVVEGVVISVDCHVNSVVDDVVGGVVVVVQLVLHLVTVFVPHLFLVTVERRAVVVVT